MRRRNLLTCGAASIALLLHLASCRGEEVRQVTISLDGVDGGALSGFNCGDGDEGEGLRACINECYSNVCLDGCKEATARSRDAGVPPPVVLNESNACTQACIAGASRCAANCSASTGRTSATPLAARANGLPVCVVFDILRINTDLECRSSAALLAQCRSQADQCGVIERKVRCLPPLEPVDADGGVDAAASIVARNYARMRAALKERFALVSASAPDGFVIVRLFATTEDEAKLAASATPDLDKVVGCAFSCPVDFASRSTVTLSLAEAFLDSCRASRVRACAAVGTPALGDALDALSGE